ncbi:MAG: tetratricopeptide repeat protein [Candidatus Kerfeldbacteria bacterium]|nr:tetratricopeptide repeat protein [Candidatus Kerfeldbacteria bacterium]
MLFDYILWGVVILCVVAIGVIVSRKFSVLSSVDVSSIPEARLDAMKTDIIEERIKRRIRRAAGMTQYASRPVGRAVGSAFRRITEYLQARQRQMQHAQSVQQVQEGTADVQSKVSTLVSQAEELLKTDELQEAEKRYIEAISLNPKNADAYYGLGEVYLEQKQYEHARDTFGFLVKLNADDDLAYHELGLVAKAMDHYDEAIEHFQHASRLAPNNPKYLDSLVDIAILKGDKVLAWENFDKLRASNPENQKLDDLRKQIESLEKRPPATTS